MSFDVKCFIAAVIAMYNYLLDCGLTDASEINLTFENNQYVFTDISLKDGILNFRFNGKNYSVNFKDGEIEFISVEHEVVKEIEEKVENIFMVKSTVSGRVVDVFVHEGDFVNEGNLLLKIEAMKMEIDVKSPVNGVVDRIFISRGVDAKLGSPLISIRVAG